MNYNSSDGPFDSSERRRRHPRLAEPRTKEEWRQYLTAAPPPRPPMPSFAEYLEMSTEAKARYNRARNDYHSAGVIVRTDTIDRILRDVARLLAVNRYQPAGARCGRVFDGPPNVGKSTLVKWIGADFENELRQADPEALVVDQGVQYVRDYTPVVYISVDSETTPKGLCIDIAEFLNIEYRPASVKNVITHQVLQALRIAGTELIVIDELHFLDLEGKQGIAVNNQLKHLANHTAATFIYTGVDLEASGLFLEGRARLSAAPNAYSVDPPEFELRATQTSARNDLHKLAPMAIGTTAQAAEWCSVIGAMEAHTALYRHRAGSLMQEHWLYLHKRTGGVIASLSRLLREAAVEAVFSGQEEITREVLDRIVIDRQAHMQYQKVVKHQSKQRAAAKAL